MGLQLVPGLSDTVSSLNACARAAALQHADEDLLNDALRSNELCCAFGELVLLDALVERINARRGVLDITAQILAMLPHHASLQHCVDCVKLHIGARCAFSCVTSSLRLHHSMVQGLQPACMLHAHCFFDATKPVQGSILSGLQHCCGKHCTASTVQQALLATFTMGRLAQCVYVDACDTSVLKEPNGLPQLLSAGLPSLELSCPGDYSLRAVQAARELQGTLLCHGQRLCHLSIDPAWEPLRLPSLHSLLCLENVHQSDELHSLHELVCADAYFAQLRRLVFSAQPCAHRTGNAPMLSSRHMPRRADVEVVEPADLPDDSAAVIDIASMCATLQCLRLRCRAAWLPMLRQLLARGCLRALNIELACTFPAATTATRALCRQHASCKAGSSSTASTSCAWSLILPEKACACQPSKAF